MFRLHGQGGKAGKTVNAPPEWRVAEAPVDYETALAVMEARVEAIIAGTAPELVWLLEHPPLYTAGTSAEDGELLAPQGFPVYRTGRGGRYTYHGPGQRVIYVMTDLRRRGQDLRAHIARLEEWIIRVLADFGVTGERREGRVGIWVVEPDGAEKKIAAIGVRVRRWVTFHGLALNIDPDLSHFSGIVPCGLAGFGVTALKAYYAEATTAAVDLAFRRHWSEVFEQTTGRE